MDIKRIYAHLLAEQIYLRKKFAKAVGVDAVSHMRDLSWRMGIDPIERMRDLSRQVGIVSLFPDNDDPDPEAIAEARIQAEEARQQYRDEQAEHGRRGAEARLQRVVPERAERAARIRKRHQQLIDADEPSVIKQLMREFDCSKSTIERALKN